MALNKETKSNHFLKVPRKNNYRLRQWYSAFGKSTHPSRNPATYLERVSASIGLHLNAHKTEYMCFNQRGDISTLNGNYLKLVDKSTYLGSSVSSIETVINTWLVKAWTATIGNRSYGSQTWPIKWSAVSSKRQSCRYCSTDALHGR